MNDEMALNAIADLMSGQEWSPATLDAIADVVRDTGREIADIDD